MSLNTSQTQTISFQVSCYSPTTTYYLKVETVTQGYSDYWGASISCTPSSVSCEDQAYQTLTSTTTQNFAQKRNELIDKISASLNRGNSLSAIQNATLQAVQYNNYQVVDTIIFNGTADRQNWEAAYLSARSAFVSANPIATQNPQFFTCQTCPQTEVDQTNYFFSKFSAINSSRFWPPAQETTEGQPQRVCGSWGNQVKLLICAAAVGGSSRGLGAGVGGWGCWCTFCNKNSWLASIIC